MSAVLTDDEKPAKTDDDILTEAKQFLKYCVDTDGENRKEGQDDLEFLSGQQWSESDKRSRQVPGMERPCLTINKLPTFLHQVTNNLRQNVPSIKVSAVDDGADVKTAEVMQGVIRHIEYASNADVAYDTAVLSAAAIGFGFFMLVTDYCEPDSFDQEIRFKRIRNPFTVYFDPMSQEPDGSDAKRVMITSKMAKIDFRRDYPDAQMSYEGFDGGANDATNSDWIDKDTVRVATYYRIVETADTLVELSNGEVGLKSKLLDMPKGVRIKRSRKTATAKVECITLTCFEVLTETEIKCKWIPVFPVYGEEIDLDGKMIRNGLVRNAKDPQKMYNYTMTSATEEVMTRNKVPYIAVEGSFEGYEDDWAQANTSNFPYLEHKGIDVSGNLAPAPARQPMADVPNGLLTLAMHANDNIKATTGLFDSSLGARGNANSGKQEVAQQKQGDLANFHYADNLNRSIKHAARCLMSMIPNYMDTERVVKIMGVDGKLSHTTINQPVTQMQPMSQAPPGSPPAMDPNGQPQQDPQTGEMMAAVDTVLHDMSVGEYAVVVQTGPSYNTLRQEAADGMIQLGSKWPKLMDVAGDKVVKTLDWPDAEGIANRIKATIAPQILQTDPDDKNQQKPPMVQTPKGPIPIDQASQLLQQQDQQIQQMGQALQEAKAGIAKAQIDAQSREKIAQGDQQVRLQIAAQAEQGKAQSVGIGHAVKRQDSQDYHQVDLAKKSADLQASAAAEQRKYSHDAQIKAMQVSADAHKQAASDQTTRDIAELQAVTQLMVAQIPSPDPIASAEDRTVKDDK